MDQNLIRGVRIGRIRSRNMRNLRRGTLPVGMSTSWTLDSATWNGLFGHPTSVTDW